MKLLFLIESMDSASGGPAAEIAHLTELLARESFVEITIASLTPRSNSVVLNDKVHYFHFQHARFLRLSWFRAVSNLKKLIAKHDMIFSTGIWGPVDGFALRLSWNRYKPVYIRVCGMLEPYIMARNPLKKKLGMSIYLRKNLDMARGIIVNSYTEAINVENAGVPKEKIIIIQNGVTVVGIEKNKRDAKKTIGINADKPVLLYLGRIHPKKGLHYLLCAVADLPRNNRQFTLLVAGEFSDDDYRSEILKLVADLELDEIVKFSGMVTGNEKKLHFKAADCFILPSQSEGLPNAVLEAMAQGLPAIVTRDCNILEISTYNAGLVIDLSVHNLTQALEWFLTGNENLQNASLNALKLIREKFNPEDTITRYKEIIYKKKRSAVS